MLCFGLLCVLSSILLSITNNVGIFTTIYKSYLIIEYMKLPQICRQLDEWTIGSNYEGIHTFICSISCYDRSYK